ncbi:host attachment protein [Tropicimonas sp. IMCC34043]|uniref:host attachment protein n=1 Tax=Tropicimonas sp. IMCC34043 TaxID=2248760 RepID=UPI000E27FC61|nr:host attachment protein [Tropicimonas sp. IMCC34043]
MRGSRTWALVMNAVRARILQGVGDGDGEGAVELVSRARSTHLRDIMTDKPGRSFSSGATGRRSAIEMGSDPILRDMQDFASETAELLEKHRRAGDFARLALFAEPKMLGILRKEFPATLWATVFLDLPLNLIALSERDLRARVLEEIRNHK